MNNRNEITENNNLQNILKDINLEEDENNFKKNLNELSISNILETPKNDLSNYKKSNILNNNFDKNKSSNKKLIDFKKDKILQNNMNFPIPFNKNIYKEKHNFKNDIYYQTKVKDFGNNKNKNKSIKEIIKNNKRNDSKNSNYSHNKNDTMYSDKSETNLISYYKNKINTLEDKINYLKNKEKIISNEFIIEKVLEKNDDDFLKIYEKINEAYISKFKNNIGLRNFLTRNKNRNSNSDDSSYEKENDTKESINIKKAMLELEEVKNYIENSKKSNTMKKNKK